MVIYSSRPIVNALPHFHVQSLILHPCVIASSTTFMNFTNPFGGTRQLPILAFVPLELAFHGIPFQSLFSIPYRFNSISQGFMLDPQIILQWNVIEHNIRFAVERLLSHHHAPMLTWIMQTALGCTGYYEDASRLQTVVINSRGWFGVLVAGLSYAIAISLTMCNDPLDSGIPQWFYILSAQQMEQFWLLGMQASSAAMFNPSVAHAGILLKILEPERGQFSVDWLCRFHVPVWYPWGIKEAQAATSNSRIARLVPLPHQLQEINNFLTKTPGEHSKFKRVILFLFTILIIPKRDSVVQSLGKHFSQIAPFGTSA